MSEIFPLNQKTSSARPRSEYFTKTDHVKSRYVRRLQSTGARERCSSSSSGMRDREAPSWNTDMDIESGRIKPDIIKAGNT